MRRDPASSDHVGRNRRRGEPRSVPEDENPCINLTFGSPRSEPAWNETESERGGPDFGVVARFLLRRGSWIDKEKSAGSERQLSFRHPSHEPPTRQVRRPRRQAIPGSHFSQACPPLSIRIALSNASSAAGSRNRYLGREAAGEVSGAAPSREPRHATRGSNP